MTDRREEMYRRSLSEPEQFWAEAAQRIHWHKPFTRVLDDSRKPFYRWFPGGEVNTCYNAVDRHVEGGRADQLAIVYDSPVTQTIRRFTYRELQSEVARCAGAIAALGVGKGDRVIVYMPAVPEAIIAVLAIARLGAVHSVVFGGFASHELASRLDDAKPKLVISGSCGIEPGRIVAYKPLLDAAIEMASHKPDHCIIYQRPMERASMIPGRDLDWNDAVGSAQPHDCVPVATTDPLYILYTSGTTGQPKGIVRDNGGHLVALSWSMEHVYGIAPGDVYWAASDIGWAVGHSYMIYGPLIHGCTTVMYEGKPVGTPNAGAFWRVISEHKVVTLFCAPTTFRAIKREDPKGEMIKGYDLSKFRALFLAGERLDPDTLGWAQNLLKVPVLDNWWQTETGWPICANCAGADALPVKVGSPGKAVPGWDVQVLDPSGKPVAANDSGALVCKLPLPPGTLPTLWNADARYQEAYLTEFPGFYKTGDAGFIDEDGYVYVMTRTDDVINVAGHRLSTGAMEEVLSAHPDVAECAVIGVADQLKGQVPLGFLVLKAGVAPERRPAILKEVVALVRERIGPVAAFKTATIVERLPKTRSGKILRGIMQKIADSEAYKMPATIDDPAILPEIQQALSSVGYAKEPSTSKGAAS